MSRVRAVVRLFCGVCFLTAGVAPALAHDSLAGCIQHRVEVTGGAQHLDVTVQLTFFEEVSAHERGDMDTDRDGCVSRAEESAYLKELEPVLSKAVSLRLNGQRVALITLYPAEMDLLGNDRVGPARHQLTLHYFARTPSDVASGSELMVEDSLWPGVRAMGSLQAQGKDGWRLEALPWTDVLLAPARDQEPRTFAARVITPPLPPIKGSPKIRKQKS